MEEDLISKLRDFSKLSFQRKVEVLKAGRPIPELRGLHQLTRQKKITRTFQKDWYTKKEWLCGCHLKNRLFCFPCLLFSAADSVWTKTGFCDLKNLPRSLSKHENSISHIQSQISLKTFGSSRIDLALNEQQRLNVSFHNSKVKENREILKVFINATCFLAKQELAFRGNDESANSLNRGNYVELIYTLAENDERLARHLETSTVFSGLSNRIQNDLIEAVAEVIRSDIRKDIDEASFVAIEVDETTDVTQKAQISMIFRYVCESSCKIKEAFLGFDDVSDDRRASAIAEYIFKVLQKYNCVEKLVAQTYDGASVMSSELHGVQSKIKAKVPEAMFTHCYAHKLNLVLLQSAKCIPDSKIFFKTLEGLSAFFSKSTKRTQLLNEVVKRRIPRASPTRWSSNSRLLQTVSMHHSDLLNLFRAIDNDEGRWDDETVIKSAGYERWLSKSSTCFLIAVYESVFNKTDALFRVLQNKIMDIGFCCEQIRETIAYVECMRQEFENFYKRFEEKCATLGLIEAIDAERLRSMKDKRKQLFYNILDNIIVQLKSRFDNFSDLAFLGLVDCSKFSQMNREFDDTKLEILSKTYAKFFDFVKLKADLIGLCSSSTVKNECKTPTGLLNFLHKHDLTKTVPEVTKLLKLVLTIPATTASVERSFSALKRIKTYNRNRTEEDRLTSLALIAIETERLQKLQRNKHEFYNKVTDVFVQKDRRMDFIYK